MTDQRRPTDTPPAIDGLEGLPVPVEATEEGKEITKDPEHRGREEGAPSPDETRHLAPNLEGTRSR